jgi:DNA-binding transcriptional LysR family regulator
MDGVLAFVAAGLGAAVVPAIAMPAETTLRAIRFEAPGLSRTVALAHRADRPVPRAAQALVAQLISLGGAGAGAGADRRRPDTKARRRRP